MNIVIAGGGKLGYYLTKTLLPHKHKIVIIDTDQETCVRNANELSIETVCGNASSIDILEQAGAKNCDVFIATTGKDESNLISCQLAKNYFYAGRTIARVNNPKNVDVLKALGVDRCFSTTEIIADMIEGVVDYAGVRVIKAMRDDNFVMCEVIIGKNSSADDVLIRDIEDLQNIVIAFVTRNGEYIIPKGNTKLLHGDNAVLIANRTDIKLINKIFIEKNR